MVLSPGIFVISGVPVTFSRYRLVLGKGTFAIDQTSIKISAVKKMALGTGSFFIEGQHLGIYKKNQPSYVIDNLAAGAPYPPYSAFVPAMSRQRPVEMFSPDIIFGSGSGNPYADIYVSYYDPATQLWNDERYQLQYPNEIIPPNLKQAVADQTYLYNQYLVDIASWLAEYDAEQVYQWPYYFAKQIIARS